LMYVRAAIDLGLDALAARDPVLFRLAVAAVLRPRAGGGAARAAQRGRVVRHDRMATAASTAETPGQRATRPHLSAALTCRAKGLKARPAGSNGKNDTAAAPAARTEHAPRTLTDMPRAGAAGDRAESH